MVVVGRETVIDLLLQMRKLDQVKHVGGDIACTDKTRTRGAFAPVECAPEAGLN